MFRIYTLEKEVNSQNTHTADEESSSLLGSTPEDPDKVFTHALDQELEKISTFYQMKELEIFGEADYLLKDVEAFEADHEPLDGTQENRAQINRRKSSTGAKNRRDSLFKSWGLATKRRGSLTSHTLERIDSGDSDGDEDTPPNLKKVKSNGSGKSGRNGSISRDNEIGKLQRKPSASLEDVDDDALSAAYDSGATIKKRMTVQYVQMCELRSFIQLNKTGFTKVLKKYDKIVDRKLKSKYIAEKVSPAYVFKQNTSDLISERIEHIEQAYANINTNGNLDQAKRELRLDLREHVVWERNTVWREMIGIERKAQAANLGIRRTILGPDNDPHNARLRGDEDQTGNLKEVNTPVGRYRCPHFLLHSTFYVLIGILAIFLVLLLVPIMEKPEQQNCLAMVIFVSLLWATEAIPLFVTSLLVPFLVVILRVVRTDQAPHVRLDSKPAASYIFGAMWTPVIMLLLGGFTIAAALSKYNIAKMMATFVLSKAGTRPRNVLLACMFVAMFASMWISNVAAPVLCFSIIQV